MRYCRTQKNPSRRDSVLPAMTDRAEPNHVQGFSVVVVVHLDLAGAAPFTGLGGQVATLLGKGT